MTVKNEIVLQRDAMCPLIVLKVVFNNRKIDINLFWYFI